MISKLRVGEFLRFYCHTTPWLQQNGILEWLTVIPARNESNVKLSSVGHDENTKFRSNKLFFQKSIQQEQR